MLNQRSSIILMVPVVAILLGNISGCSNFSSVQAKEANFVCAQVDGVPTTVAKTKNSDIPIIKWVSNDFDGAGWSPDKRCAEVSGRFQTYYQNGSLKYITTGQINNENAICTASQEGGDCTDLLFTVKPGFNPQVTLQKLIAIRHGGNETLTETGKRPYLDVDKFLGVDSAGQSPKPLW
jgi:Circadian oscillating protein COP23